VRQILTFARQAEEKVEPIIVSPIVKEALKLIRSSIPSTVEIQSKISSHSMILGNPTQVHQIIMNLCTNAAQAMDKSGGILAVDLTDTYLGPEFCELPAELPAGEYLMLSVADTGCGISPEIIHAIFEPYFTTKPPGEGTGMGLSVVQGIVENYGGKITVQSKLGRGSTFTVYLPIARRENSPPSRAAANSLPAGNEHILFVDDEPTLVKMAGRMLQRLGYRATLQTSSLEALNLFHAKPDDFDLVITDLTMPQMTGDLLASELMRIRPEIPVMVCTGYSKKMNEELAAEIGIKAFIFKPIEKSEMAKTIRKVLDAGIKSKKANKAY
ncbi:MAG: ATP-binding protein, partial [Desulfobacteraceae bacterium]|nr:ATP-binding protein [Desulfobacteraceae bacterium]